MPEGFEYDPEAIRAFAEVFDQASTQLEQVRATLGDTTAKAADFGTSWGEHGTKFESYIAALTEDLANLTTGLAAVAGQLNQGTDLIVTADTTALRDLKATGAGGTE
jgi:uncharacterized protein YukE